jgi:signal transduction histidine kinase/CheY-like chemotaxis protein
VHFLDWFRQLFSTGFMPHAYCLRDSSLIAVHAAADSVIALSYLLIPAALLIFVRRRRDIAFPWMFTLFAIFILGCGATHTFAVVTLWRPLYRLDALLKVTTALASIGTTVMLFRLLPKLMLIPSPAQLREVNARLEEAALAADAANLAKSAFLSTMSHEIRTPLNAILGYAQLMQRDPALGADAKNNLSIIGRSGEHLLGLINDVLDLSKIEAGRAEIRLVNFNLHSMLQDLSSMFRLRAEAKGLDFEMVVDGEAVLYLSADEGKIRQALINLLANAIKFTSHGKVKLHVRIDTASPGKYLLSAQVEDTGDGIPEEEQRQLFEPFHQAQRRGSRQEGTGLGLAISRQFARLMGGDLTVTSRPGLGSTFRFQIPIECGDAGAAVRQNVPRRVIGIRAGTHVPKILVVDDQSGNREWIIKLLGSVGFSVRGAENGELAIRNWNIWRPQLILMDVHMPMMDGLEATRRIKETPLGKETLIVILTAGALDVDRRNAAESGADGFLSKPLREDDLLEEIAKLLDVVYDHQEVDEGKGQSTQEAATLNAEILRRLPLDLVEKLRDATRSGNKKSLVALIQVVSESQDAGCALCLQNLADKYEYDTLTWLLDEACRR